MARSTARSFESRTLQPGSGIPRARALRSLLAHIERNCSFDGKRPYRFKVIKTAAYDPASDHIIGNGAELLADGTFSQSFDARFVRTSGQDQLSVISGEGKQVAVKNWVEQRHDQRVVFVAGNSDGDDAMTRSVLDKGAAGTPVLAMGVNPRGSAFPATLAHYAEQANVRTLAIHQDERSE